MYLMAPDNTFLAFYNLDLSENELATQLTDDISYDIGSRFLGTGNIPAPSKWKLSEILKSICGK